MKMLTEMRQEWRKTKEEHSRKLNEHDEALKSISIELAKMNQTLQSRPQGSLPSDTVPNPKGKEQCFAVTRSILAIPEKQNVYLMGIKYTYI